MTRDAESLYDLWNRNQEISRLAEKLAASEANAEALKKMMLNAKAALARPCPQCGYVQKQIKEARP